MAILSGLACLLLLAIMAGFAVIVIHTYRQRYSAIYGKVIAACDNPGCIRCQQYGAVMARAYKRSCNDSTASARLIRAAEDLACTPSCITLQPLQCPTLLAVPNLPSEPFPASDSFPAELIAIVKQYTPLLAAEYRQRAWQPHLTHSNQAPWRSNKVPTGSWTYLSLVNQGVEQDFLKYCPVAAELLERLSPWTCQDVFGNALYSELSPGSSIEPHCGPTNTRWRLHVPLSEDQGAAIAVGTAGCRRWKMNEPFLIDDSFEHSVDYKEGTTPRVVFIVDVYHPNLTASERQSLSRWFQPSMLA
eukprot:m.21140 g.21140  ORF g.21140 m.21140 type:complete len:303 (+) comp11103_c0_seq5:96-1004(+)